MSGKRTTTRRTLAGGCLLLVGACSSPSQPQRHSVAPFPPHIQSARASASSAAPAVREAPPNAPLPRHDFDVGRDRTLSVKCGPDAWKPRPVDPMPPPYDRCSAEGYTGVGVDFGPHEDIAKFDRFLTDRYRQHLGGDTSQCCYSSSSDVQSRPTAAPTKPPHGAVVDCFAAMPRGTAHPAAGRADCPAAIPGAYGLPGLFQPTESTRQGELIREESGFHELALCCYLVPGHRKLNPI